MGKKWMILLCSFSVLTLICSIISTSLIFYGDRARTQENSNKVLANNNVYKNTLVVYEQDNNTDQIIKFIEEVKKRNYNMMLIYARMIFPTYYFDLIEKKDEDISKDIYNLINKKEKFEYITNYFANKYIKK